MVRVRRSLVLGSLRFSESNNKGLVVVYFIESLNTVYKNSLRAKDTTFQGIVKVFSLLRLPKVTTLKWILVSLDVYLSPVPFTSLPESVATILKLKLMLRLMVRKPKG